jgi:pSer/pThr/pTyr-binding forkhead associated (FHA) protein
VQQEETVKEDFTMPANVTLRVKNGKLAGRSYEFDHPRLCLIGRRQDCEIRLPDYPEFSTVSRHHCILDIEPPAIRVRDSGSMNGTFVNGMQIGRPAKWHLPPETASRPCFEYDLTEGDELRVGDTIFEVHAAASEERGPEPAEELGAEEELCACG